MIEEDISGRETLVPLGGDLQLDLLAEGERDREAFDIDAIVTSLSRQPRWLGGRDKQSPLSVLEHSFHVGLITHKILDSRCGFPRIDISRESVVQTVMWGYAHDFHEAFMGDINRPVARALAKLAGGTDYVSKLKEMLDVRIMRHLGLSEHLVLHDVVKQADDLMCAWEAKQLCMDAVTWSFDVDVEMNRIDYHPPEKPAGLLFAIQGAFSTFIRDMQTELADMKGSSL